MTKIIFKSAVEVSDWEEQARAAARITDSSTRYFAMRAARAAHRRSVFRKLRAIARAHVNAFAVKRLYEKVRTERWDAVAPYGMNPA
jgi:hypothetical protein